MQRYLSDGTNDYLVEYERVDGDVYIDVDSFGPQFKHVVEQDIISSREFNGKVYGSAKEYLYRLTEMYRKLDHNKDMQRIIILNMGACRLLLDQCYEPDLIRAMLTNQ